jgi:hypothetical protein
VEEILAADIAAGGQVASRQVGRVVGHQVERQAMDRVRDDLGEEGPAAAVNPELRRGRRAQGVEERRAVRAEEAQATTVVVARHHDRRDRSAPTEHVLEARV